MIAFFDLDGTLLPLPSVERRLIARLLAQGQLSLGRLSRCALQIGIEKIKGDRWAQQRNKDYLAGLSVAEVEETARALALDLSTLLRPELLGQLEAHARNGHRIVLLTGAIEALARPIADIVCRQSTVCATRCASQGGRFVAEPPERHPFGTDKATLARTIARDQGVALHACWAYGDSRHDSALLDTVGHPVAVHPDRLLRRQAERRGWPIIDDRDGTRIAPALPAHRA